MNRQIGRPSGGCRHGARRITAICCLVASSSWLGCAGEGIGPDPPSDPVGALRVPVYDLVSNWAYMVMAALAWNLKSWLAMMMHLKADRRKYIAMEFRRFVREMILVPCQVIRRSRRTTLRIIGWRPATDRLFSVWRTIERTGFG